MCGREGAPLGDLRIDTLEVRRRCHQVSRCSLRAAFNALAIQLREVDKPIFLVGVAKGQPSWVLGDLRQLRQTLSTINTEQIG